MPRACEWVILGEPAVGRVLIRDALLSVSHSVTDEYKMKGVEKVKYISGEEAGVDGQENTVRDFSFGFFCILICL